MSRTKRNIEHANLNAQRIRTTNQRRAELAAAEEILDEGYSPSNRLKNSINRVPNTYDDKRVAGYDENYDN